MSWARSDKRREKAKTRRRLKQARIEAQAKGITVCELHRARFNSNMYDRG